MTEPMATPTRRPRRDAIANRRRILDEADRYFGEYGTEASLHELARRVGVGIGTIYRHFPTHRDLIESLYLRFLDDLVGIDLGGPDETPWARIELLLTGIADRVQEHPGLLPVMRRMTQYDPDWRPGSVTEAPIEALVTAAHADGTLRADVTGVDLVMLPLAAASVAVRPGAVGRIAVTRVLHVLIDGIRASEDHRPMPAQQLDVDDYHRMMHRIDEQ